MVKERAKEIMTVHGEKCQDRDQQWEQFPLARAGGVNLTKEGTSKLRLEHGIRIH